MSQHTPGPWRILGGKGKSIIFCPSRNGYSGCEVGGVNAEANARLIAKAPEMLTLIQQWVDKGLLDGIALEDARALLREIEGETP